LVNVPAQAAAPDNTKTERVLRIGVFMLALVEWKDRGLRISPIFSQY
jgi:hypothetical protein